MEFIQHLPELWASFRGELLHLAGACCHRELGSGWLVSKGDQVKEVM